ncbi:hypothetical protein Tco_0455403 [Tanacetum coccineum]
MDITVVTLVGEQMSPWKGACVLLVAEVGGSLRIIKSNEKNNETIIALMPILSVEDLCCCISVSKVVSNDWSLVSAVLGQITYPVASLTPDSARSYVMQGTPFTQGTIPSIPIGGSIRPEGFLSSILLLVVIIVTVLIVAVILVVVVIAIIGVVIVVVFIGIVVVVGGVSSIFKLSFVIIGVLRRIMFYYLLHQPLSYGWAYAFHQDRASLVRVPVANVTLFSSAQLLRENTDSVRSNQRMRPTAPSFPVFTIGVPVGPVFLLGLLALVIVAACASRAAAMPSVISCWMAAKVMDSMEILEFKTSRDKYGDNGISDSIGGLVFKASNSLNSSRTGSSPSGRVNLTGDEDPTDEDGDTEMGDLTGVSVSLCGEIFSGGKKSRE